MNYNELLARVTILTKRNDITQTEIGKAVGLDRAGANGRAKRNSKFKPDEIKKIEEHFNVRLNSVKIVSNSFETVNNQEIIENFQTIGERLTEVQVELGYLDKAMARLMEIDEKKYMKIKLGDVEPTLSELLRLASKVDVSLDWLIRG